MEQQPAPPPPPPRRRGGRPATGRTPVRTIRLGDLWDRCFALAEQRGEKMTALVERALVAEERRLLRQQKRAAEEKDDQ